MGERSTGTVLTRGAILATCLGATACFDFDRSFGKLHVLSSDPAGNELYVCELPSLQ